MRCYHLSSRANFSVVLTLCLCTVVSGQTIYSDNFDSYSRIVAPVTFTSTYEFVPNTVANGMEPSQVYSITENLSRNNGTFSAPVTQHPAIGTSEPNQFGALHPFYDHTSNNGSGNYMAINAGNNTTIYRPVIQIPVIPNTQYQFNLWMMSWTNANGNFGRVEVNLLGNNSNMFSFLDAPPVGDYSKWGTWALRSFTFDSGNNNLIILDLRNNDSNLVGNDYGIDDISIVQLASVPEPGVIGLGCFAALSGTVMAYHTYRRKSRHKRH